MYNIVGDVKMNNKSIELFNYVYSNMYEEEKSDDLKWEEFEKICLEKMKYLPYDFIIENDSLLTMNKKCMWQDLAGNKGTVGKFVILNYLGQKEYINYKIKELKAIISNYGKEAFKNLDNIFNNMCNEAIREILIESRNAGLIYFNDNIFKYYDDRLGIILFDNINIVINSNYNNSNSNGDTIVYGTYISQQGNNNVASINNVKDEELFLLLEEKIEALRLEMNNKNCEDKLVELENAIKKKDKKNVLNILSDLASIGSFIAAMFIK